jgi:hypothetical protein
MKRTLRENAGALGGPVTCLGPLCQLWADEDELHSVSLNIGQHRSVRLPPTGDDQQNCSGGS